MKKYIIGGVILLGLAGGAIAYTLRGGNEIQFRELHAKKGRIAIEVLSTGTVEPSNRLEIKPPVAGRVEQVLIKEGQVVQKGQVLAWMSSSERAALLDAARAEGAEEFKRWEQDYKATPVLAPISGRIILRNVESGQTFTSTDALFTMSDRLTVKAAVDETDMAQIKVGQEAEIVLDAYSNEKLPARVDRIAFDATTTNNVTTYVVEVLPLKPSERMRSGMTANVTFHVDAKDDVLTLPSSALRAGTDGTTVLVRDAHGAPIDRAVETGLTDGKHTEIVSGLSESDVVLVAEASKTGSKSTSSTNPFMPRPPGGNKGGGGPPR